MADTAADRMDEACPASCGMAVGEHTMRGYMACLDRAGYNHYTPHEDLPGGPTHMTMGEDELAGDVTVESCVLPTPLGPFPVLRFKFTGANGQDLKPVALLLDAEHMKAFRQIVWNGTDAKTFGTDF